MPPISAIFPRISSSHFYFILFLRVNKIAFLVFFTLPGSAGTVAVAPEPRAGAARTPGDDRDPVDFRPPVTEPDQNTGIGLDRFHLGFQKLKKILEE